MKSIFLILVFSFSFRAHGQNNNEWIYGTDEKAEVVKGSCKTLDGGFIIGGEQFDSLTNVRNIFLLKIDSSANIVWSKIIKGTPFFSFDDIKSTIDSNYIICAAAQVPQQNVDIYLIKIDGNGNILWSETLGTAQQDECYKIRTLADGSFILGGSTMIWPNSSNGHGAVYIIKVGMNGIMQWSKIYDGGVCDYFRDITISPTNGYLLTGYTSLSLSPPSIRSFFLRVDSTGNILWSKRFDLNVSSASLCHTLSNGNFLVTGYDLVRGTYLLEISDAGQIVRAAGANIFLSPTASFMSNSIFEAAAQGSKINVWKVDTNFNFIWSHKLQNIYYDGYSSAGIIDQINDSVYSLITTSPLDNHDISFRRFTDFIGGCDDTISFTASMPDTSTVQMNFSVLDDCASSFRTLTDSVIYFNRKSVCGNVLNEINFVKKYDLDISLYPNPFDRIITISCDEEFQMTIFNLNGKLITRYDLKSGTSTPNLDFLPPGIYLATFDNGSKKIYKKLIKS